MHQRRVSEKSTLWIKYKSFQIERLAGATSITNPCTTLVLCVVRNVNRAMVKVFRTVTAVAAWWKNKKSSGFLIWLIFCNKDALQHCSYTTPHNLFTRTRVQKNKKRNLANGETVGLLCTTSSWNIRIRSKVSSEFITSWTLRSKTKILLNWNL